MGVGMRHLFHMVITFAGFASLALAGPAAAQALAARAWSVPTEGVHEVKISYGDDRDRNTCVKAEMSPRPGVTPFLKSWNCFEPSVFTMRFVSRDRVTLEVDKSGQCVTIARGVILGPPGIDVLPCNNDPDQQFTLIRGEGDHVNIQGTGGCWTGRLLRTIHNDMVEERCENSRYQRFRILDANPPAPAGPAQVATATPEGAVAPPGMDKRPVARPVEPAPPVTRIAPLPPGTTATVPTLPGPGEGTSPIAWRLAPANAAEGMGCYFRIGGGGGFTPRVDPGACVDGPEAEVTISPANDGSVALTMGAPAECFTAGARPWIALERCTASEGQAFRISPAAARGQYQIKTGAGLCLTQRGNPNGNRTQNNSALFAEPCRDTPEQAFVFRPIRQ